MTGLSEQSGHTSQAVSSGACQDLPSETAASSSHIADQKIVSENKQQIIAAKSLPFHMSRDMRFPTMWHFVKS